MQKQKKLLAQIIVFLMIIVSSCQVYATDITDYLEEVEYSERYQEYLKLNKEEKLKVTKVPTMFKIPKTNTKVTNPLSIVSKLMSTSYANYSLHTVIPENMVVKNQMQTETGFAFSMLGTLESNLAIQDYKDGLVPKVYDYSERHMEYAMSRTFLNNQINENGYNREVGSGSVMEMPLAYLTNGTGAIAEADMPFENNEDKINISEIKNKEVVTQVNDTKLFAAYGYYSNREEIKQQMKEHIINYGAIDAGICGPEFSPASQIYNNETAALYCSDATQYPIDYSVMIVGWDDEFATENFAEGNRPTSNGAWIAKMSFGTEKSYTLSEMREYIYENYPEEREKYAWTSADEVPDTTAINNFKRWGYTVNNNVATYKFGNDGFIYISYEDVNIYEELQGIVDAQTEKTYENIYQYDYYGGMYALRYKKPELYFGTVFNRQTTGTEYLTQVAINLLDSATCKVYVNPKNSSKAVENLQEVALKTGETETLDSGYHTIEFAQPIRLEGSSFAVVIKATGADGEVSFINEINYGESYPGEEHADDAYHFYDNVTIEEEKCFIATEAGFAEDIWQDTSLFNYDTDGAFPNFDTSVKAFTVSKILESIKVSTPPTKTTYIAGQDFDPTGMVVTAVYTENQTEEIDDYVILDGEELGLGQTSVTIAYEGKITTQPIVVEANTVTGIEIKTPPTKVEYYAGDNFDATGMVVEAIYKDGTRQTITDYEIVDGQALKNNQITVTIKYEDFTATQPITILENTVVRIEIMADATKLEYVVGQTFDPTGLRIKAIYANGAENEVTDFSIVDGTDLKLGQTTVTIQYEGLTVTQAITVVEKSATGIEIKTLPIKTKYEQEREKLNLEGGVIEIKYNDGSTEDLSMTSPDVTATGFDNKVVGEQTITVTYKNYTAEFKITIEESKKPLPSDFEDMDGNVTKIRVYYNSDKSEKQYSIISVELTNIVRATENDKVDYYYYLSVNPKEQIITDWVKIKEVNENSNGLTFDIDTRDINNYSELSAANEIYLYVREVVTRNGMKAERITDPITLNTEHIEVEEYVDDEKKSESNSDDIIDSTPADKEDAKAPEKPEKQEDNTKAPGSIPKAGKDILMIAVAILAIGIGKSAYKKYKNIKLK